MRRRLALSLALLGLTGTLVAQTSQQPHTQSMPLTQPNRFGGMVSYATSQQNGDKLRMTGVRLEFELGITVTADELVFDKAKDGVIQLSGNVQMALKK